MNFIGYRYWFFSFSAILLLVSAYFLIFHGLRPSIDFAGGSAIELRKISQELSAQEELDIIETVFPESEIRIEGDSRLTIQTQELSNEEKDQKLAALAESGLSVEELRFEAIGPSLSKELLKKTITALLLVAGIITWYIWRQFDELRFGVCAVLAMLHDSLILLGAFSIFGYFFAVKVDVLFVTALLTTLSFSVHDTIVVYDRVRELYRKNRQAPFASIVNTATLETLVRSLNNSITIIIVLAALALLGGETIRWFAIALLIGAITGTYSSTFTAAPLLVLWEELSKRKQKV